MTTSGVSISNKQIIAAIVALAAVIGLILKVTVMANIEQQTVITNAYLKSVSESSTAQKLTAESISKMADAINNNTEIIKDSAEKTEREHEELCSLLKKGNGGK